MRNIVYIILIFSTAIFGQTRKFKVKSVMTTFNDKGKVITEFDLNLLKKENIKKKIILDQDQFLLVMFDQNESRFIQFKPIYRKFKSIVDDEPSFLYPDNSLIKCFNSDSCSVSKSLLNMISQKNINFDFLVSTVNEIDGSEFILFFLENNILILICPNKSSILELKPEPIKLGKMRN